MSEMTVSAARGVLPEVIESAQTEPVVLSRHGKPVAVVISPKRYEQLLAALEDAEDNDLFDAALAEEGPNIPWEQVKSDLGWNE